MLQKQATMEKGKLLSKIVIFHFYNKNQMRNLIFIQQILLMSRAPSSPHYGQLKSRQRYEPVSPKYAYSIVSSSSMRPSEGFPSQDYFFIINNVRPFQKKFQQIVSFKPVWSQFDSQFASIVPKFNKDGNFWSPAFIIELEKNNIYGQQQLFQYRIKQQLDLVNSNQDSIPTPRFPIRDGAQFCKVCQSKFRDYMTHIKSKTHKKSIKKSMGNKFIKKLVKSFQKRKKKRVQYAGQDQNGANQQQNDSSRSSQTKKISKKKKSKKQSKQKKGKQAEKKQKQKNKKKKGKKGKNKESQIQEIIIDDDEQYLPDCQEYDQSYNSYRGGPRSY